MPAIFARITSHFSKPLGRIFFGDLFSVLEALEDANAKRNENENWQESFHLWPRKRSLDVASTLVDDSYPIALSRRFRQEMSTAVNIANVQIREDSGQNFVAVLNWLR
jgi:hypothetical protein